MEYVVLGLLGICALNLVVSILLPLILSWCNFVFRSNINIWFYQDFKEKKLVGWWKDSGGESLFFGDFFIGTIVPGTIVIVFIGLGCEIFGKENFSEIFDYVGWIVIAVIVTPFLRWVVDVSRNLRVKSSTGDSERLKELQEEMELLKSKIEEK